MTTLVTGFLNLDVLDASITRHRQVDSYIGLGIKLLSVPINKVIFIDDTLIHNFKMYENEYNKLIPFKATDIWLWKYKDEISKIEIHPNNTSKDTHAYHMLIANKTEFIRMAIELNPFNTDTFGWCDFGVFHLSRDDDDFSKSIKECFEKPIPISKIRLPGIWDFPPFENCSSLRIDKEPYWFFCGGLFFGYKDTLLKFDLLCKSMMLLLIANDKITFEVNIWFAIYSRYPELFDRYGATHSVLMFKNNC